MACFKPHRRSAREFRFYRCSEGSGTMRNVTVTTTAPPARCFYRIRAMLENHAP